MIAKRLMSAMLRSQRSLRDLRKYQESAGTIVRSAVAKLGRMISAIRTPRVAISAVGLSCLRSASAAHGSLTTRQKCDGQERNFCHRPSR